VDSVRLSATGEELEPDFLTSLLNTAPTQSWKRGQQRAIGQYGRTYTYPWGGWQLCWSGDSIAGAEAILIEFSKLCVKLTSYKNTPFEFNAELEVEFFGVPNAPFTVQPEVIDNAGDVPIKFQLVSGGRNQK